MNMKKKKWSTDHMNFEALLQNRTLHKVHHILFAQVYIFFTDLRKEEPVSNFRLNRGGLLKTGKF